MKENFIYLAFARKSLSFIRIFFIVFNILGGILNNIWFNIDQISLIKIDIILLFMMHLASFEVNKIKLNIEHEKGVSIVYIISSICGFVDDEDKGRRELTRICDAYKSGEIKSIYDLCDFVRNNKSL